MFEIFINDIVCPQTFTNYKEVLLNCHKRDGITIPKAYISTAAQVIFFIL